MDLVVRQGWYHPAGARMRSEQKGIVDALQRLDVPFAVIGTDTGPAIATGGQAVMGSGTPPAGAHSLLGWSPALTPDCLGDPSFQAAYGVRCNYMCGAMANGISSTEILIAMARAGMMACFGAAGLPTERIARAVDVIQTEVPGLPVSFNLIHSPADPEQEQETVDLYLARRIRVISAAAYLELTPQLVQYRATGMTRNNDGRIHVPNRILAKVSREEVADRFLHPPPRGLLARLVAESKISASEAELASQVPMADDITAEADSGGHTDNRPLPVLLPLMISLRDRIAKETGHWVRIGAAGGIATPSAVAGAFALGAAYVVTGSINQTCVESGTSPMVKAMLAEATANDIGMAPASDMFESGVQVQVLKRGTLFPMRAKRLYQLYRHFPSLDTLPADEIVKLEKQVFRRPIDQVWADCVKHFSVRDASQLERAARDPKHKMALVFRWYLGMASRWAIAGDEERKADAQIWCGPAIGAFNDWTRNSFLAQLENRRVAVVAANLMAGAAAITRAHMLQLQGIDVGPAAFTWTPRPPS